MSDSAAHLQRVQRWFHASITHPEGSRAGLESDAVKRLLPAAYRQLEDIVLPSTELTSTERLSIYANMYFERLIDILAEEFPTVRYLLGPQIFADVVRNYVTRHPSTHYSLARLGRNFPQFLLDESGKISIPNREFAAAVATVERTMEDVFDEEQVEPLVFDEIEAIPPERWHAVRLKTISALRLLELPYPVNAYISAVRDKKSVSIPVASRSFVVVYRLNYRVWRMDLDELQFTLLFELRKGRTLGEALSVCAERHDDNVAVLADSLHEWFRTWSAEGFFHKVDIG